MAVWWIKFFLSLGHSKCPKMKINFSWEAIVSLIGRTSCVTIIRCVINGKLIMIVVTPAVV